MAMKKFINNPDNLTRELLEGYCLAYADKVALRAEKLVCRAGSPFAGVQAAYPDIFDFKEEP